MVVEPFRLARPLHAPNINNLLSSENKSDATTATPGRISGRNARVLTGKELRAFMRDSTDTTFSPFTGIPVDEYPDSQATPDDVLIDEIGD